MAYRAETFRTDTLITVAELAERIAAADPVTVVDVRWRLDRPDGRADYVLGHIPGAVYADLETELSDRSVTGHGRHPLPKGVAVQAAARRWGACAGVPIVVYDDWNRAGSARAWWVLRAAGIHDVRILDGGLGAWVAAGYELVDGVEHPVAGDIRVVFDDLYEGALATLTTIETAAVPERGVLVDMRSPERFRGEVEPVDPVAGHIPGARNVPGAALLDERGFFRSSAELAALFAEIGVGDAATVGVYCGSGVTAAVGVAALKLVGVDAALYPGSWSQWSAHPSGPVAVGDGDEAGDDR